MVSTAVDAHPKAHPSEEHQKCTGSSSLDDYTQGLQLGKRKRNDILANDDINLQQSSSRYLEEFPPEILLEIIGRVLPLRGHPWTGEEYVYERLRKVNRRFRALVTDLTFNDASRPLLLSIQEHGNSRVPTLLFMGERFCPDAAWINQNVALPMFRPIFLLGELATTEFARHCRYVLLDIDIPLPDEDYLGEALILLECVFSELCKGHTKPPRHIFHVHVRLTYRISPDSEIFETEDHKLAAIISRISLTLGRENRVRISAYGYRVVNNATSIPLACHPSASLPAPYDAKASFAAVREALQQRRCEEGFETNRQDLMSTIQLCYLLRATGGMAMNGSGFLHKAILEYTHDGSRSASILASLKEVAGKHIRRQQMLLARCEEWLSADGNIASHRLQIDGWQGTAWPRID